MASIGGEQLDEVLRSIRPTGPADPLFVTSLHCLPECSACADVRYAYRTSGAPVARAVNDAFLLVEKSVEL